MSALRSLGLLVRQAGQAFESFGAYLQGSGPELGPYFLETHAIARCRNNLIQEMLGSAVLHEK